MAAAVVPSSCTAFDALQAQIDSLSEHSLYLSNAETHQVSHDLLANLTLLISILNLPPSRQQKLKDLTAKILDDQTAVRAEFVDVLRKSTACKELMALARKEQENVKRGTGGQVKAVVEDRNEERADMIPGRDVSGGEATWLRLL